MFELFKIVFLWLVVIIGFAILGIEKRQKENSKLTYATKIEPDTVGYLVEKHMMSCKYFDFTNKYGKIINKKYYRLPCDFTASLLRKKPLSYSVYTIDDYYRDGGDKPYDQVCKVLPRLNIKLDTDNNYLVDERLPN